MNVVKYFETNLMACPNCGEKSLNSEGCEPQDAFVICEVSCNNCGAEFQEVYKIDYIEFGSDGEEELYSKTEVPFISLENDFERGVLKLVEEGVCGHDQVYELSYSLVNKLDSETLLTIVLDKHDFIKLSPEKIEYLGQEDIFDVVKLNLNNYLDEVYIYEIAKEHGFEVI